jgi:GTP cyclohydrolase II
MVLEEKRIEEFLDKHRKYIKQKKEEHVIKETTKSSGKTEYQNMRCSQDILLYCNVKMNV